VRGGIPDRGAARRQISWRRAGAAAKMYKLGIHTGLDLRRRTQAFLTAHFGKAGDYFYGLVRAEDDRPVMADHRRKSLGAETTFARDLLAWEEVAPALEPVFAKMWAAYSRPQSPGLTDARPMQVVDPAARYHHELRLAGVGNGPPKPIRRRRTDRKEISWYGFAAQARFGADSHIIAETDGARGWR
jgi:nucleotidyltransferase/DNA polymerase involved in DNA repair